MHGSGIDCDKKTRLRNESRQSKQICFSGKIDYPLSRPLLDLRDMFFLESRRTAR
jgi:hypothetical protein